MPRLFGFLEKKDSDLIAFHAYEPPSDLKVGKSDGELYWKGKRIKRSNFTAPRLGALVLGIATICGIALTAIANWDKIKTNLGIEPANASETLNSG